MSHVQVNTKQRTFLWEADETEFLLSNSSIGNKKTQKVVLAVIWESFGI